MSLLSEQKPNLNHKNRLTAPQSIPKLESVYRTPWMKEEAGSHWGLVHCQKFMLLIFLLIFPRGADSLFSRITVHWGKINNQNFCGLLDTGSELTLILGAPKYHYGMVRVGVYGDQVGKTLAQVYLTVWPSVSLNPPCGYFPSSRTHDKDRHTQLMAESPRWSLTCGVRLLSWKKPSDSY